MKIRIKKNKKVIQEAMKSPADLPEDFFVKIETFGDFVEVSYQHKDGLDDSIEGMLVAEQMYEDSCVANSYESKVINGTSMNFMDLFDMAISDPEVSTYINGLGIGAEAALEKRKLIDILVDAWNTGQFNIRQVYKGLGIKKKEAN